jgi:hypothetical protein
MSGQPAWRAEADELGVSLFMNKPVAPSRVVGVVERYCAHAKPS